MTQQWPPGYTTPANTWVINPTGSDGQVSATGVYTDLNWPGSSHFNYDVFITPELDIPHDGYFWAHQFAFASGSGGYIGIQANGSPGDGQQTPGNKIVIMSIWDALGARGGDWNNTFSEGGSGYSVGIHYNWIAGRQYRLRVWIDDADANGNPFWIGTVYDTLTQTETVVGWVKVPKVWGWLSTFSIFWTERFFGSNATCSSLECSSAILWTAAADNATTVLTSPNTNNHFGNPVHCLTSQFTGVSGALSRQIVGLPLPPVNLNPPSPPAPPRTPPPIIVSSTLNLPEVITTTWWNTNFPFRRRLKIDATREPFPKSHPVVVEISSENTIKRGKIKLDLSNVVVVYTLNNVWTPLPNKIELSDDNTKILITFDLVEDVNLGTVLTNRYYIYYGSVYEIPQTPSYTPLEWPVQVPYSDSLVTYTRPGEHWIAGISHVRGGRATFRFTGSRVRLISNKGNNYGIAEVQIDDTGPWIEVDMFSYSAAAEQEVFKMDLDTETHTVRVRCTGRQHPSSSDFSINIVRFEYNKDVEAIDMGEEIDDLNWVSFTGGAE